MPPDTVPAADATGYAVIAEFNVEPSRFDQFIALADSFARECLETEPGCLQFDVVCLDTRPHGVVFVEAYASQADFDAHCRAPHLARFKSAFAPLIVRELALRRGPRTSR